MALKKFIVIHSELHFVATVCLLSGRCQLKCKSEQVFKIRYTVAYALQLEFGKYLLLSYMHTEMRYSKIASKNILGQKQSFSSYMAQIIASNFWLSIYAFIKAADSEFAWKTIGRTVGGWWMLK